MTYIYIDLVLGWCCFSRSVVDIRFDGLVTLYAANLSLSPANDRRVLRTTTTMLITPSSAQSSRDGGQPAAYFLHLTPPSLLFEAPARSRSHYPNPGGSPCEGIKGTGETVPSHNLLPRRNILYYCAVSWTLGHLSSSTVWRLLLPATNSFSAGLIRSYHVLLHQITRRQSLRRFSISHNRIKQAEQYVLYPNHFASRLNTLAQQRLRRQPLSGALRSFETSLKYGVPPATGYQCTLRHPTRALMSLDFRASHPLRWFGPLINISPCSALQTASIHDNQNPWLLDKHLNPCGSSSGR
jgi:hypothetical protein